MSHFYTPEGMPAHEGGLAEARKRGYFPSVTTVCRIIANEGISRYREEQMLMAALTLPRRAGENDGEFAQRVITDAREHSREAAGIGIAVHEVIESFWHTGIFHAASLPPPVRPSAPEILQALTGDGLHGWAEVSFANHHLGYGGRIDFFGYQADGTPVIVDYKTQGVKESLKSGLPRFVVYPEWAMQLASYRHAVSQIPGFGEFRHARCMTLVVSTSADHPGVKLKEWAEEHGTQMNLTRALRQFMAACSLYYHTHNLGFTSANEMTSIPESIERISA